MDQAGILSESTQRKLSAALMDLKNRGTMQLQVLTISSLGGLPIEEASIKIVDQWKLGDKDTDKGVLFLIAPNERKMRIEVGQGLEGDIPDVIAKRIIADVVTPYFKQSQFDSGVAAGVVALARQVDPNAFEGVQESRPQSNGGKKGFPIWVILLFFFVIFLKAILGGGGGGRGFGRRGGFGGWGGGGGGGGGFGGGGGGGWGGGGGGFSGGGSSGSW